MLNNTYLKIGIAGAISPLRKAFAFSTLALPHYIDNIKLSIPFGFISAQPTK